MLSPSMKSQFLDRRLLATIVPSTCCSPPDIFCISISRLKNTSWNSKWFDHLDIKFLSFRVSFILWICRHAHISIWIWSLLFRYKCKMRHTCARPCLWASSAVRGGVQMQRRARVTIQLISRTMPMANWAVQSVSIATAAAAMLWQTLVSTTLLFAVLELVGVEAGPRPRAQVVFSNSITSHSFPKCRFEGLN